jgi:hypothetical protein
MSDEISFNILNGMYVARVNYANGSSYKVSANSIAKLESTQGLRRGIGRVRKYGSALVIQWNNLRTFQVYTKL